MTSRHDFPATSIGRSAAMMRMNQASSHEAHDTHPLLLSSSSPAGGSVEQVNTTAGGNNSGVPKYVPYTPRQRVTPTAATTGTIVHPSSPQHQQGDATSKLQLMHLKAAAQTVGLDSGTLGWAILERLVLDIEISEEWTEIWNAITTGRATLLLPLESAFTNERVTSDFVKDHVVLCDSSSRNEAPIITLSGLRGTLNEETLTFRSTLHPSSKLFQDILNPVTRTSSLTLLPPLPAPSPDIPAPHYPEFTLPSHTSTLHLPHRSAAINKPPLPPRPNARPAVTSSSTGTSRLANPFASLFGGNYNKLPAPVPASPPASLHSIDSSQDHTTPVEVSAFTIDRRIVRKDIGKEINKTVKAELKATLGAVTASTTFVLPGWVVDRMVDVCQDWFPFVKDPGSLSPKKKLGGMDKSKNGKDGNNGGYVVNPNQPSAEDVAERLQDFYFCLEQDMRSEGTPFVPRWKGGSGGHNSHAGSREDGEQSEVEDEKEKEKRVNHRLESETRVRDVMEGVERTVTSVFYDRLFMQPVTDDASHDEALSSRVAALNMLDLGLRHLGIDPGEAANEPDLDAVVKACGEMLSQLNNCFCPSDKAEILVAAHKIVVDGLSRLPPICLISEEERDTAAAAAEEEDPQTAKPFPSQTQSQSQSQALSHLSPGTASSEKTSSTSLPIDIPNSDASSRSESTAWSQPSPLPPLPTSPSEVTSSPPTPATATTGDKETKHIPPPLPLSPRPNTTTAADSSTSMKSVLEMERSPKKPTPVSGDVLLPLIIFSVVKSNPAHLVSHLLFTQRFRNQSVGGEESYCLINLMAVAEFIENVDLAGLGLGDVERVLSIADLTPIPLTRSPVTSETPLAPATDGSGGALLHGTIRGRVEQQVDAIADSANKVISGVVDSSFGILRSFMPGTPGSGAGVGVGGVVGVGSGHGHIGAGAAGVGGPAGLNTKSTPTTPRTEAAELKVGSASSAFGLLRKDSGFSIANLAASLPLSVPRGRGSGNPNANGEEGQQLVNVSRPSSVRSRNSLRVNVGGGDDDDDDDDDDEEEEDDDDEGEDEEDEDGDVEDEEGRESEVGYGYGYGSGYGRSEGDGDGETDGDESAVSDAGGTDVSDVEDGAGGGGGARARGGGGEDEMGEASGVDSSSVHGRGDARSIRSFESMLSASKERARKRAGENANLKDKRKGGGKGGSGKASGKGTGKDKKGASKDKNQTAKGDTTNWSDKQRKTLSARLASVSAFAGLKGSEPPSRRESLLQPPVAGQSPTITTSTAGANVNANAGVIVKSSGSPVSSRAASPHPNPISPLSNPTSPHTNPQLSQSPLPNPQSQSPLPNPQPQSPLPNPLTSPQPQLRIPPPRQRFIECTPDDLRLSEVGELLRDYRRLVEAIRGVGGFDE